MMFISDNDPSVAGNCEKPFGFQRGKAMGQQIGYERVSMSGQDLSLRINHLKAAGCT